MGAFVGTGPRSKGNRRGTGESPPRNEYVIGVATGNLRLRSIRAVASKRRALGWFLVTFGGLFGHQHQSPVEVMRRTPM